MMGVALRRYLAQVVTLYKIYETSMMRYINEAGIWLGDCYCYICFIATVTSIRQNTEQVL